MVQVLHSLEWLVFNIVTVFDVAMMSKYVCSAVLLRLNVHYLPVYTVSQKTCHSSLRHNFGKG